MMNPWRVMTAAYSLSLEKRPLLTEMTTSGCLWCFGDLATQFLEQKRQQANNNNRKQEGGIDWKRTLHQTVYASIIWGPFAHKWYHLLDHVARAMVGTSKNPAHLVAAKLALEIICLHPVSLLAYFSIVGKMGGESLSTIQKQLRSDYWPTLMLEIALWTPLDTLNFSLVPVRHQLLVVNCGCFVESVGLSFIKNNGIDSVKRMLHLTSEEEDDDDKREKKEK